MFYICRLKFQKPMSRNNLINLLHLIFWYKVMQKMLKILIFRCFFITQTNTELAGWFYKFQKRKYPALVQIMFLCATWHYIP